MLWFERKIYYGIIINYTRCSAHHKPYNNQSRQQLSLKLTMRDIKHVNLIICKLSHTMDETCLKHIIKSMGIPNQMTFKWLSAYKLYVYLSFNVIINALNSIFGFNQILAIILDFCLKSTYFSLQSNDFINHLIKKLF